jgi:orotate phosphoribosyltransferase-like protein
MSQVSKVKEIRTLSNKEIDKELNFIVNNFPEKLSKHNYQLSNKLLKIDESSVSRSNLQSELQRVADIMTTHLMLSRPIKVLVIDNTHASATFETIEVIFEDNLYSIRVNNDLKYQSFKQKVALIAQSMTLYLLSHKYNFKYTNGIERNKIHNEVFGIFLGFGFLYSQTNTQNVVVEGNVRKISRVGVLDQVTINKIIARTAMVRKQNPIWILKSANLSGKTFFFWELFSLIISYYKHKIFKASTKGKARTTFPSKKKQSGTDKNLVTESLDLDENFMLRSEINQMLNFSKSNCSDFVRRYRKKNPNLSEKDILEKILYDLKRDMK